MRLFVIEDEQSLREDITKKLQRSGYEVDACGDGETASEYLSVEYYDLILLAALKIFAIRKYACKFLPCLQKRRKVPPAHAISALPMGLFGFVREWEQAVYSTSLR